MRWIIALLLVAPAFAQPGNLLLLGAGGSNAAPPKTVLTTGSCSGTTVISCTAINSGSTNFTAGTSIQIAMVSASGTNPVISSITACSGDTAVQDTNSPQTISAGAPAEVALYLIASTSGGCDSVTVTMASSTGISYKVGTVSFSPGSARDVSAGAHTTTSTTPVAVSLSTTAANELLVSAYATENAPGTSTVPTGFTALVNTGGVSIAYATVTSLQTNPCAWSTTNSVLWAGLCAGYK